MGNSSNIEHQAGSDNIKKYFFRITAGIEMILGAILLCLIFVFFFKHSIDLRTMLAIALIIIWFGVVIIYLSWAIYFYNVNMGLTDEDWQKIENNNDGSNANTGPDSNPNSDQSLGLPTGTVRAIIALTLLVAVLALAIVYFGNDRSVKENEIFIDSLDFFKTAFLMMIAFYFGSKSLEFLKVPAANSGPGSNPGKPVAGAIGAVQPPAVQNNVPAKTSDNVEG